MFRSKFSQIILAAALALSGSAPLSASCGQSYLRFYNFTEKELRVYVDGVEYGNVGPGYSPTWIPARFGMHKIEAYHCGGWKSVSKWAETSYSAPNAWVEVARFDI